MRRDVPMFELPWDRHKYIEIAVNGPLNFHIAPYCWRFGKPLLASILPFGLEMSFLSISFLSVLLAGILSWLIARDCGFSRPLALTGVLFFFSLQWAPKFFLFEFWLPDSTIFALIILSVWLLLRGNLITFVVVATLGVTVKESMLFVLPLAYTFRAREMLDWRAARQAVALALLPISMLIAIRLAIPAWNDDPQYVATLPERLWLVSDGSPRYDLVDALQRELRNRVERFDLEQARLYLTGTFGIAMTLLPLFAWRRNPMWLVRFSPFLVLVASQMLFGHDIERYLILAFPAALIMALNGLAALSERLRMPEISWTVIPLTLTALELVMTEEFFLPFRFQLAALAVSIVLIAALRQMLPYQHAPLGRNPKSVPS
jgi:hypothetical protein